MKRGSVENVKSFVGLMISFFTLLGIYGLFKAFQKISEAEVTNFMWEGIMFAFALATLAWGFSFTKFKGLHPKLMPFCGLLFLLCGVLALMSFGVIQIGIIFESLNTAFFGAALFWLSNLCISVGIGFMVTELIDGISSSKK